MLQVMEECILLIGLRIFLRIVRVSRRGFFSKRGVFNYPFKDKCTPNSDTISSSFAAQLKPGLRIEKYDLNNSEWLAGDVAVITFNERKARGEPYRFGHAAICAGGRTLFDYGGERPYVGQEIEDGKVKGGKIQIRQTTTFSKWAHTIRVFKTQTNTTNNG